MFERALQILRLQRGADKEEVRKSYIKMTRRYPPEHFPQKFKQIKEAYEQLTLSWPLMETRVKQLLTARDTEQLMQNILEEPLEEAGISEDENKPQELNVWSLEPIFNANKHEDNLRSILEEIRREQGLGEPNRQE